MKKKPRSGTPSIRFYISTDQLSGMHAATWGTISLILGVSAVLFGFLAMIRESLTPGLLYLAYAGGCGILIVAVFCTACPIRTSCVHIIPGYLARFFPPRNGPYSRADLILTTVLFAAIILPPQFFLIHQGYLLTLFWISLGGAALISYVVLCPGCGNQFCPLRR